MKKVSIIVPVHNSEKYIEQCIDSILNQTFTDFELIIINDNSVDSSPVILDNYCKKDNRIILKHVCAGSAGKARNYGLKEASGFYLSFIDSDDWIEPTYLEDLIDELEKNDCDCAMCGVNLHFEDASVQTRTMSECGNVVGGECMRNGTLISILPDCNNDRTFYLWDKIYKRSLWENITFDPELKNAEDRLALYTLFTNNVRTIITNKLLYNYRMGVGITSHKSLDNKYYDYDAGYKMLNIAKEKGYDLYPVYQTIVSHTLGKARSMIRKSDFSQYCVVADEFKKIYNDCKTVISMSKLKYRIPSFFFRYFHRTMYCCCRFIEKIKNVL